MVPRLGHVEVIGARSLAVSEEPYDRHKRALRAAIDEARVSERRLAR